MKIAVVGQGHQSFISEFMARQEKHQRSDPVFQEAWSKVGESGGGLLVLDHVKCDEEFPEFFDYPRIDDDMLVGLIAICESVGDNEGNLLDAARDTYLNVSPEYHNEASLVIMLQDLIASIITNGMPYKMLWFVQAREGEDAGDDTLCDALERADLATGYINDSSGMSGYCADLRVGHYLWSVVNRRNQEEG